MHVLAAILAVSASLNITVWPEGQKTPDDQANKRTWTLRCTPAAGTLPRAANACVRLAAIKTPFAQPKGAGRVGRIGQVCTAIYGGPQTALVTGTFRSRRVHATFSRVNGCEIARWTKLRFLFPVAVGSASSN